MDSWLSDCLKAPASPAKASPSTRCGTRSRRPCSRGASYPKLVQSLLGHSSITQTMDTYSHLMDGIGGDAVDGLDEAFG